MAYVGGMLIGMAICVVFFWAIFFIIQAVGLYNISKKRGMKNSFLSFIPVASCYIAGNIADNINSCIGKKTMMRLLFPLANAIFLVGTVISFSQLSGEMFSGIMTATDDMAIFETMMPLLAITGITSLLNLAYMITKLITLYRIFADYVPNNAVLYMVLSIFFQFLTPFFILSIRNKPSISMQQQKTPVIPINL